MKLNPKDTLRKVGLLFAGFVLTYALLRFIIHLADAFSMPWIYYAGTALYGIAVVALFVAFYILNGFTLGRTEYAEEDLPDRWTPEKKADFLRKLPANRARARSLMYILMPIVVTLLLSYIELSFFS